METTSAAQSSPPEEVCERATAGCGAAQPTRSDAGCQPAGDAQMEVEDFSSLQLLNKIGSGGFATVYTARWQGTVLAVKLFHTATSAPVDSEALLRRLRHPCICTMFGVATIDRGALTYPALVLEYMGGGSLSAWLFHHRGSPPPPVSGAEDALPRSAGSSLADARPSLSAPSGADVRRACAQTDSPTLVAEPGIHCSSSDQTSSTSDRRTATLLSYSVQVASGLAFLHTHGMPARRLECGRAALATCSFAFPRGN